MKKHIICLLTVGLGLANRSSLAAEDPPKATPPPAWEGSAFMGFTLTRGNSDSVLVTANVKANKKDKQNEWALGVDGSYGENDSIKNSETLHGFGQYNRLFTERFFGYLRADALHDGIADLDYRFTVGPGVGYYFIKEKATSLAGEIGPGYVIERLGNKDDCYATVRVAERFEHKFGDRARVWQSAEFLPNLGDLDNYVINFEAGLGASLSKNLELTVVLQDNYVNEPAAGRKCNDLKLISGVTWKF